MSKNSDSEVVEAVIANRKTEKVLCEVSTHEPVPRELVQRSKNVILRSVKAAGWAPFHHPRNYNGIAMQKVLILIHRTMPSLFTKFIR